MKIGKPEYAWVVAFGAIFTALFFRGFLSGDLYALGMSLVLNAYPVSRAIYKLGRVEMRYDYRTSEFKASLILFGLGLGFLLAGILAPRSAVLMMVSSSFVFVFCQGFSQKLHADKTIRTQVLLR